MGTLYRAPRVEGRREAQESGGRAHEGPPREPQREAGGLGHRRGEAMGLSTVSAPILLLRSRPRVLEADGRGRDRCDAFAEIPPPPPSPLSPQALEPIEVAQLPSSPDSIPQSQET